MSIWDKVSNRMNTVSKRVDPLSITVVYLLMAGLWIILSEPVLRHFHHQVIVVLMRLVYSILSAWILLWLMKRQTSLRESRDQLRQVVELLREPIIIHRDSRIIYANPYAVEFLDAQSMQDLVGRCVLDFIHPDYHRVVTQRINTLNQGIATPLLEQKFLTLTGRPRDVEVVAVPITYEGRPAVQAIIRDITKRKQAEATLKETVSLFQLIEEYMTDGITVLDTDGNILYTSASHYTLFGRSAIETNPDLRTTNVHPDDLPLLEGVLSGRAPILTETRIRHQDGHWMTVEIKGAPAPDDEGNLTRMVIVVRDITERKNSEELMRRTDKLAAVGELAAGIAHEIRNPLTSIKGFLQLMLPEATGTKKQYFDIMHNELTRIEVITSELLMLAKPQDILVKGHNVHHILQEVITLLGPRGILSNVDIQLKCEPPSTMVAFDSMPENCRVRCNEGQLKQVFINLIKNAIEAMHDGGNLQVVIRGGEDNLSVQIIDEGVGIESGLLANIGKPFFTTKPDGTGLGMLVTQRILEHHGGHMEIASQVGVGTTVTVVLPLAAREDESDLDVIA